MRIANMVPAEDLPYESITSMVYDSGDYAESVRRAQKAIHHDEVRQRQLAQPIDSIRRLGLGYASYTEQTAHGAEEWSKRGLPIIFGYETARATIEPDGSLVLDVGIQSHGQGLETSLAQVAHDVLGVDPASVTVRHGDSGISPFGMGTFASRSMVMAGGATHLACERLSAKLSSIAAHLLDCHLDGPQRPFLLLLPAWVAATDYWLGFLRTLAERRGGPAAEGGAAADGLLERRAGVFYISPLERYSFLHAQATGRAEAPFHAVWFCGGWASDGDRRRATASLKPARRAKTIELFRTARMLQRRGHFPIQ